ncbi:MAG: 50S ribosomal protein L17 [Candidatus Aminicenantes bacterium]|nr:50S ribosomal protein L17 [Candidatus Aminicenantes bacterium]
MRHKVSGKRLRRNSPQRRALLRSQVTSLIERERIKTTLAKAKETRPLAEKIITLGRKDSVHARRLAARFLYKRSVVKKLFDDIGPRFSERPGGYTRIVKLGPRSGDGAEMAFLEMVSYEYKKKSKKKTLKEKAKEAREAKK